MGYNIRIGNAVPETEWPSNPEYQDDEPLAHWVVERVMLEPAPFFPDSGRSNGRDPSYTGWSDFAEALNLYDFFFDKGVGKMRRHPGCFKLTKEDVDLVRQRVETYKAARPDAQPIYCQCARETCDPIGVGLKKDAPRPPHNPNADMNLMRAEWLLWWMEWAVNSCERPAIWNM